jgi:ABC-type transport system involved in multi-copper enzyme maturation permease subunit
MILHIAKREALEHARSARFLVLCALAIALMPLSAFVAAREYDARAAWSASLEAALQIGRLRTATEGNDLASRFGWRTDFVQTDQALRAIRPPSPGSVIATGFDTAMPTYWQFGTEGLANGEVAAPPAGVAGQHAFVDLALIVELVLGLLAILLTYDGVSAERESGLLRAVLAHPVSRIDVALGKFAGAAASLAVPLMFGSVLSVLVLMVRHFPIASADVWPRVLLFATIAGAYLAVLLSLGLLVSTICRQARTSLFVSIVAWVALVFVVPHGAQALASTVRPIAPAELTRLNKTQGVRDIARTRARALGLAWRTASGSDLPPDGGIVAEDTRRRYEALRAPVEQRFTREKRDLLRAVSDEQTRARSRQERMALALGSLSPTVSFRVAAAAAAGTGAAYRERWESAVARHQRVLELATFDRAFGLEIFPPALNFLRVTIWPSASDPADRVPAYTDLPQFSTVRDDLSGDLREAAPALALLLAESGLLLLLACGALLWTEVS